MNWHSLDLWIVIGYILFMLAIAFRYRAFAGTTMDNFFLGGRKIPGWMNGISYTAALVSPDAATGYGGLAIVTGGFICWWYLSRFGLALFIGGVLFAVFWRHLKLFTALEFYDLRFGPRAAAAMRLWIALRTSLIAMPAWTGITLLAACKIMGPSFDFTKWETLALVVPVSFLFVFSAGYRGVVVSNFIQMIIFLVGTITLAALTLVHFGGASAMAATLNQALGSTHPEILTTVPPVDHTVFPLAAALGWLVGQSIGYGGDATPMGGAVEGQRILSTRTPAEALTMYVTAASSMFLLLLLVTLPCISAAVLWPDLRMPGADRELVYGRLMKLLLPSGAMGLMIAGMLAAAMSTVADNINFGSQVLVSDIYRQWIVRNASERHYLIVGKIGMGVILAIALMVVFNVRIIVDVAIFMLQLSSAELTANWAQWWWWRFNGRARVAASFGGAAIFCLVVLVPKALSAAGVPWAAALMIPWWWQTLLIMGLTSALWATTALLTRPDPERLLRSFYDRARPLGWWAPYQRALDTRYPWKPIARGLLIALIGTSSICLIMVGMTHAWFASYGLGAVLFAAGCILFVIFRLLANSYLSYLSKRVEPSNVEEIPAPRDAETLEVPA